MDGRLASAQMELIVLRVRKNDAEAFEELVEAWEKRLFYFVRRMVRQEDDAWDVLQETWVKIHAGIRHLRDPSAFPAWAYKITRNTVISHLRKSKHCEVFDEDDPPQEVLDASDSYTFSADEAELIHWGLDQLPLLQREALTLFFLEGFSLNEIADVTHVSPGTVKSRLFYGRKKLRDIIEQEAYYYE